MSRLRRAKSLRVERRRTTKTARRDHSVAVAKAAVALRAIDVEAALPSIHHLGRDGHREPIPWLTADHARLEIGIGYELSTGDGAGNARARRHPVGKERARLEGVVARLLAHLLVAAGRDGQREQRDREATTGHRRSPVDAVYRGNCGPHRD